MSSNANCSSRCGGMERTWSWKASIVILALFLAVQP